MPELAGAGPSRPVLERSSPISSRPTISPRSRPSKAESHDYVTLLALRSRRDRSATPDRRQGAVSGRADRKLHPPYRSGGSCRQCGDCARLRAGAGDGEALRGRRHAWRSARPAAWPAGRHQGPGGYRRPAHDLWQRDLRRPSAERGRRRRRLAAGGRRHRSRQDQRSGMGRRRQHAQCRLRCHRQSVRSDALRRRIVRRLGGGARMRDGAARLGLRHRRLVAQSGGVLRRRRLPADARPRPEREAGNGVDPALDAGSDGADVAGPVPEAWLMLSVRMSDDRRDPLTPAVPGWLRTDRGAYAAPAPVDLSRLRVAVTHDFGFAPTERQVAETLADKVGLFRSAFARVDETTPDCAGADEAFEVLRALLFLGRYREMLRDPPDKVGPNVRANIEEGLRYSAEDAARGFTLQTMLYRRWQEFYRNYDVILTPSVTISSRAWRELYPVEIDGKPTRTYFHWLALACAVTLAGHPALSLPVGLDRHGMPFGLQIVGPRGGDAFVMSVAAALESLLARDTRTARPTPDLDKLKSSPPIAGMEGFRDFG